MEIRALAEGDDRSQFHSGDPDLDRFFHQFAGQNQFRHYVGVSYVAVEGRSILGFATVAPGHVEVEGLREFGQVLAIVPVIPAPGIVKAVTDLRCGSPELLTTGHPAGVRCREVLGIERA